MLVKFYEEDDKTWTCCIEIINNGEASYNRRQPTSINHIGTLGYRSFNFAHFKRTCDTVPSPPPPAPRRAR